MSQWSLTNPSQLKLHFEWFLYKGILVKVHAAAQYPILMKKNGTFDNEVPQIEVILGHFPENNKDYYNDVTVRIYSPKKNYPAVMISVWKSGPQPKSLSPDILVNLAEMQLSTAFDLLKNIGNLFKLAKARVKEARAFPTIFKTRSEYQLACDKLDVEALPDELCRSYGVQYGVYKFPDYNGDHCLTMKLARRRLRGLNNDTKSDAHPAEKPPYPEKEVWEHCKICGREPVYLPLHLCEHCWPKV